MSPCERCDFIGPDGSKTQAALRESTRATHAFIEALVGPVSDWQMRVLDRVMEARGKVSPSITIWRGRRL